MLGFKLIYVSKSGSSNMASIFLAYTSVRWVKTTSVEYVNTDYLVQPKSLLRSENKT